jgi:nucleotide-binding universal stress UspA family protein
VDFLNFVLGLHKELARSRYSRWRRPEDNNAEEMITLARKTPDNFIAMSTHGRSGIQRWVLGSVTDRVVRHSGDPVLIIRSA